MTARIENECNVCRCFIPDDKELCESCALKKAKNVVFQYETGCLALDVSMIFETKNNRMVSYTKEKCRLLFKHISKICWKPEKKLEFYNLVNEVNPEMAAEYKAKYMKSKTLW